MRLLYAVYFFWIADWGEKATKVLWRFPFNKNSGLKFRTFCLSSGGKDTFLLHKPDPGHRAFRAFAHANPNATIKIKQKSPQKWQTHSSHHSKLIDLDCSAWMHKKGKCAISYSQMEARFLQIFTNVRRSEQQFRQHTGLKVNSEMIR